MRNTGAQAEEQALSFLLCHGLKLEQRNYACRLGEIDLILLDGKTLVFVEVKAREGKVFGDAAEAVTPTKRRRIVALATEYLARHHLSDHPCRFDVVSIQMNAGQSTIEVFQGAFDATGD